MALVYSTTCICVYTIKIWKSPLSRANVGVQHVEYNHGKIYNFYISHIFLFYMPNPSDVY